MYQNHERMERYCPACKGYVPTPYLILSYLILSNLFRAYLMCPTRLQGCLDPGLETHTFSILVCTYLFESLSPIKKRHLKSYLQNTVPEIMAAVLRSGVQKLHVTLMIHRPNGSLLKWIYLYFPPAHHHLQASH